MPTDSEMSPLMDDVTTTINRGCCSVAPLVKALTDTIATINLAPAYRQAVFTLAILEISRVAAKHLIVTPDLDPLTAEQWTQIGEMISSRAAEAQECIDAAQSVMGRA